MKPYLPLSVFVCAGIALLAYGPIAQFADYHNFADQRTFAGIPRAADVLSNVAFAVVALWGVAYLRRARSWGYALFVISLLLTAIGSAFYHLAPDDSRLVWDRIPIALACAGLLAGVRAESLGHHDDRRDTLLLAILAVGSVLWWKATGDLRPYLLIQSLPLILVPLWQWLYRAAPERRIAFGAAIALYMFAKFAELNDHAIYNWAGIVSGHTIKHLVSACAAAIVVGELRGRVFLALYRDARLAGQYSTDPFATR